MLLPMLTNITSTHFFPLGIVVWDAGCLTLFYKFMVTCIWRFKFSQHDLIPFKVDRFSLKLLLFEQSNQWQSDNFIMASKSQQIHNPRQLKSELLTASSKARIFMPMSCALFCSSLLNIGMDFSNEKTTLIPRNVVGNQILLLLQEPL